MWSNALILFCAVIIGTLLSASFYIIRLPKLKMSSEVAPVENVRNLDAWFSRLHEHKKFNGTVLIAKQGRVVFSNSYGMNGLDSSVQLNEHSSFNLASVSKQFTAMAIVLLKQQGKLDYNDKLIAFIPELKPYDSVSIHHLLNHTSGIADYMRLAKPVLKGHDVFTNVDLVALLSQQQPALNFEPGDRFQYSNTGYVLLSHVVERVSGITFERFMDEHVFEPLRMHDSKIHNLLSEREPPNRVLGYGYKFNIFGGKKKLNDLNNFDGVTGDGAVYASANDLMLWHQALQNESLVSKDDYALALQPAKLNDGSTSNYGFGWFLNDDASIEHAGGWLGFTSYIYRNPSNGDLIIILDNSTNTLRVNSFGNRINSIGLNLKAWLNAY